MTESTVSEVVERLESLCAQEWPDTDFVYAGDRITFGFLRTLLSTIKAGKEDHGLSRDHDPTTCIARERIALEGIASCIDNAIKPSNGPHRFLLPSGEVMVGEIADTVYRILTGLRDIARDALSSQTQVAGESSRDAPKSLSQPDHAPGEGGACDGCGAPLGALHEPDCKYLTQPQTEGGAA